MENGWTAGLIACPDCDLLQRQVALPTGATGRCCRCFSPLYRSNKNGLNRALAFIMAATVFYIIANVYPVLILEKQGMRTASTLAGAVGSLWKQDMRLVATVVTITAIGAPGAEISLLLYILYSMKRRRTSRLPRLIMLLHKVRSWQMVEVFLLGLLVSFVKLGGIAIVTPGIALWSFGALTLLLAATSVSLDERAIWRWLREDSTPPMRENHGDTGL